MIRVIDYETTGFQEDEDAEIIEAGSYDLVLFDNGTWNIRRPFRSFVRPRNGIPAASRAVHHISEADVADAPPLRDVIDDFLDEAEVCAAHNAKFEAYFTGRPEINWICTYKCALVVWPEAPSHGNQALRYWLGVDDEVDFKPNMSMPPHRALPDAYVTAFILRRLLAERTAKELLLISEYPALKRVMNFGKHKGMTFSDAPADYLEWIRDKSEMDEDTKFSAKYWLKKREAGA